MKKAPPNPIVDSITQTGKSGPIRSALPKALWWIIRTILGARGVLNPESGQGDPPLRPDRALYRCAQQVKAEAVGPGGRRVDYQALKGSAAHHELRRITRSLPLCRLQDLGDEQDRLAFWINLYNALILDAVLHYDVQGRIGTGFFQRAAYDVCGHRFCADDIEHGVLRANRRHPLYKLRPFPPGDPRRNATIKRFDPRIHFALNCGARSCPPIAFYEGEQMEAQLETATASFFRGGGARVDLDAGVLHLSRILKWYQSDFGGESGVLSLVAEHLADPKEANAVRSGALSIRYLEYDWTVNQLL